MLNGPQTDIDAFNRLTSPDSNSVIRAQAAEELAKVGKPAVPQLVAVLSDNNPGVRRFALYALRRTGDDARTVVPNVYSLLNDEDPHVRSEAIATLTRLETNSNELARRCVLMLADADESVRNNARIALVSLGHRALPHLSQAAEHQESVVRHGVALTLWQLDISSEEVGETSRRLLSDADSKVSTAAFRVLAKTRLVTHDDFLLVLHNNDTAGLIQALQLPSAVFLPADEELASRLVELTRHSNVNVQLLATHRLRLAGKATLKFVPALSQKLNDESELHRLTAANTLGVIGAAREIYAPILIDLISKTESVDIAWWSALALAESSPADVTEVTPVLVQKLRLDDEKSKMAALSTLMGFETLAEPTIPLLIELLKHDEPLVRTKAALVLANIGPLGSQAIPELMKCAAIELDTSYVSQFGRSRDEIAPPLGRRRRPGFDIPILVRISGAKAVSLWQQSREVDPTVAVITALGRIAVDNEEVSELVIKGAKSPSSAVRAATATAVANMKCKSDDVLVALQMLINDDSRTVRLDAARAIGRLGLISEVAELDEGESPQNAWLLEAARQANSESNAPSM